MKPIEFLTLADSYNQKIDSMSQDEKITNIDIQPLLIELNQLYSIKEQTFALLTKTMMDENYTYSPHDGLIHSLKINKNGVMLLRFSSSAYNDGTQTEFYKFFDLAMNLEKIPANGIELKRGSIIMDLVFNEKEFAIHFLHPQNHSKSFIESYNISDIFISKSMCLKYEKFIPKEFQQKQHLRYKI